MRLLFSVVQPANRDAVYQPNLKQKSDADIMRDAKMEAMGLRPEDHEPPKHKQSRMATDDVVSDESGRGDLLLTSVCRSWNVSRSVCESESRLAFFSLAWKRYLSLGPVAMTSTTTL